MIIDTLDNLCKYEALNPLFSDVVKYIRENDLAAMLPGHYEIKGGDLFVNIDVSAAKSKEDCVLETHRKMIDIQIPLDTEECYGYSPLCDLPSAEYNEAKDITKYPETKCQQYAVCRQGMFAMFMPQDGHAPCIASVKTIKKAIFKIKAQ